MKINKRMTPGKCTSANVYQHIHKLPKYPPWNSQLHICRRLVYDISRQQLSRHRNDTHISDGNHDNIIQSETTMCKSTQDQVCVFHLRKRYAQREHNFTWNGTRFYMETPAYLGAHLDRTLSYETHICNTTQKVNACNNIIRKTRIGKAEH